MTSAFFAPRIRAPSIVTTDVWHYFFRRKKYLERRPCLLQTSGDGRKKDQRAHSAAGGNSENTHSYVEEKKIRKKSENTPST